MIFHVTRCYWHISHREREACSTPAGRELSLLSWLCASASASRHAATSSCCCFTSSCISLNSSLRWAPSFNTIHDNQRWGSGGWRESDDTPGYIHYTRNVRADTKLGRKVLEPSLSIPRGENQRNGTTNGKRGNTAPNNHKNKLIQVSVGGRVGCSCFDHQRALRHDMVLIVFAQNWDKTFCKLEGHTKRHV